MKKILTIILALTPIMTMAQGWKTDWDASLRTAASSGEFMPFWARTGHDGILPYTSSALATVGGTAGYYAENGIFVEAGTNLAGAISNPCTYNKGGITGMVDRLYFSAGWKMLRMDIGMIGREKTLGDLSISGGDIMYSGNARNMPGINLRTQDWIYFEKGHWIGIKGNFAHYEMNDNRWVKGTKLHNKSVDIKLALGKNIDIIGGLHHYCQWGGTSPTAGPQPATFKDYLRILTARQGGESASSSDQQNALGNHLGKEYVRINVRTKDVAIAFQYDLVFEDGRALFKTQGFPDGIWSLGFEMTDRKAFVTDIMLEFVHTTWQSGEIHDRPATEEELPFLDPNDYYGSQGLICVGGRDNYFNNSPYTSGWTFKNRVIGLPLMTVAAPGEDGITRGIVNNRIRAYHIGLRGNFCEGLPYTFRSTFSKNLGKYSQSETSPFASHPWQLSLGLDLDLDFLRGKLPFGMSAGIYGDIGELYQNCLGLAVTFRY